MEPEASASPAGTELERRRGEQVERSRVWINMSHAERKRRASKAAGERDEEGLWELLQAFLMRADASAHTLRSYRYGLRTLLASFESVNLLRATPSDAERYRFDLEHPQGPAKLSASTVRQRMSVAAAFYAALRWADATDVEPFREAARPRASDRVADRMRGKAVREEELEAMLLHVRQRKHVMKRAVELEVTLLLGAHAGLRSGEMLALRWPDVDFATLQVKVRQGKGRVDRLAQMSRALGAALMELRALPPDKDQGDRVLSLRSPRALYERVARLWAETVGTWPADRGRAFKGVGVHGLRHYAGVRLADEAGDLRVVRDHLGHVSVQTTEGYAASKSARIVRDW